MRSIEAFVFAFLTVIWIMVSVYSHKALSHVLIAFTFIFATILIIAITFLLTISRID